MQLSHKTKNGEVEAGRTYLLIPTLDSHPITCGATGLLRRKSSYASQLIISSGGHQIRMPFQGRLDAKPICMSHLSPHPRGCLLDDGLSTGPDTCVLELNRESRKKNTYLEC